MRQVVVVIIVVVSDAVVALIPVAGSALSFVACSRLDARSHGSQLARLRPMLTMLSVFQPDTAALHLQSTAVAQCRS